jgi:hypothetical protein
MRHESVRIAVKLAMLGMLVGCTNPRASILLLERGAQGTDHGQP